MGVQGNLLGGVHRLAELLLRDALLLLRAPRGNVFSEYGGCAEEEENKLLKPSIRIGEAARKQGNCEWTTYDAPAGNASSRTYILTRSAASRTHIFVTSLCVQRKASCPLPPEFRKSAFSGFGELVPGR